MTKEEWEEECGFFDREEYLVSAIKKHLLTEEQKNRLHQLDLTIEDLLNGRYPYGLSETIQREFYDPWNVKLGLDEFKATL